MVLTLQTKKLCVFTISSKQFSLKQTCNAECGELLIINFIISVLSRFRINLLAANHLIIWQKTKADTEQKSSKFLLDIRTLVSSVSLVLIYNFSGNGHLYIYYKQQGPKLTLEELHISMYLSQRKNFDLHQKILFPLYVFC